MPNRQYIGGISMENFLIGIICLIVCIVFIIKKHKDYLFLVSRMNTEYTDLIIRSEELARSHYRARCKSIVGDIKDRLLNTDNNDDATKTSVHKNSIIEITNEEIEKLDDKSLVVKTIPEPSEKLQDPFIILFGMNPFSKPSYAEFL